MKCKILIFLYAIILMSCLNYADNYKNQYKECFAKGRYGEPLEKFYKYENCKLEDLNVTYPCPMDISLVHELIDLFGSDSTIVEKIGGGGFCDIYWTERPFCNSSNPQNGCDTLDVRVRLANSDSVGFFYSLIRNERWEAISAGRWKR
jgi:hypothetical protein